MTSSYKPEAEGDSVGAERALHEAMAHHNAGEIQQAEALYREVLRTSPDHLEALRLLGTLACQVGQGAIALQLIDRAIEIASGSAELYLARGNALFLLRRYPEAAASYEQAIRLNPGNAELHHNRGSALHAQGSYHAALESYDKAIVLRPGYAEAHCNRASTLSALHRCADALESCESALRLRPEYAEAHTSRANALYGLERYEAALQDCDIAIQLKPGLSEAWWNRGNALQALQRHQAAVESYDKAIALNPSSAEAYNNRGTALHALAMDEAAVASYDKATKLNPGYADAWCNRGHTLYALKQYRAALESYDQALQLKPEFDYLQGMRLHMRRFLCDWEGIDRDTEQLAMAVERGERAALPFTVLAALDSPSLQRRAAEIYVRNKFQPRGSGPAIVRRNHDKICIGYFSADYYNHATSYLIAEVFERHDRARFEVIGFSFGPAAKDEMSERMSAAVDRFMDVSAMPDPEVAQLSRELGVDIAVDLKGFTKDHRTGIFSWRAAPIQVNYLGYPGTMAADFIDYLIADRTLISESDRQFYSEKIVSLPASYQPNDSRRAIDGTPCTRADAGLPDQAFVFGCFNNTYKITPSVFDSWMRVLAQVEGSVLWLLEDNSDASRHLRNEATKRGIAAERLIFASPKSSAEHLARHRLADLVLDTFPYTAHTTASDALWVGVPILTRTGRTFASRVAASLLRAVDMPELITETEAEFESVAVELARNPARVQALRIRLHNQGRSASLFDTESYTRHLEAAYVAMYERHLAGLPPEHIEIQLPRN